MIHSASTDSDYQISALPYHYDDQPDKVWPVIYVLDANLYFGLVVDMVRAMNIRVEDCNELPDAFIVGIGYPVEGSLSAILHEVMHRRLRDFLPDRDPDAEEFIQQSFPVASPALAGRRQRSGRFLHHELVPLIESEYRADPDDRTLLGHSWGRRSRSTRSSGIRVSSAATSSRAPARTLRTRRRMHESMTACLFASTS